MYVLLLVEHGYEKEEYATELFADDFQYWNGNPGTTDKREQALVSKWCNRVMQTMHMGHQPMIWFIDSDHARGVFNMKTICATLMMPRPARAGQSIVRTLLRKTVYGVLAVTVWLIAKWTVFIAILSHLSHGCPRIGKNLHIK